MIRSSPSSFPPFQVLFRRRPIPPITFVDFPHIEKLNCTLSYSSKNKTCCVTFKYCNGVPHILSSAGHKKKFGSSETQIRILLTRSVFGGAVPSYLPWLGQADTMPVLSQPAISQIETPSSSSSFLSGQSRTNFSAAHLGKIELGKEKGFKTRDFLLPCSLLTKVGGTCKGGKEIWGGGRTSGQDIGQ